MNNAILNNLQNPVYKLYFHFLSYVLSLINTLNIELQSESCKVDVLLTNLASLFKTILRNFIKREYLNSVDIQYVNVSNPHNFLAIENMYCGAKVDLLISSTTIDNCELVKFRTNVLSFYIELSKQIQKRFNFKDEVLTFCSNFAPKVALSGEINSIVHSLF